jgi:hypothetical protein
MLYHSFHLDYIYVRGKRYKTRHNETANVVYAEESGDNSRLL